MEEFLRNVTQESHDETPKKEEESETRSIPENDSMKDIIGGFVDSLFFTAEEEQEEIPEVVCDFVSSLLDNEKESGTELPGSFYDTGESKSMAKIFNKNKYNLKHKMINKNKNRTNATLTPKKISQKKIYQNNKKLEYSTRHYGYNSNYPKKNIIRLTSMKKKKPIPTEPVDHDSNINGLSEFSKQEYSDTVKSKIESEKEKKEYEEKVRSMKNHITAIKRKQDELSKKMILLKNKEKYLSTKKKEKEDTKKMMLQNKIMKQHELESKKKHTELQKNSINKGLQESTQKAKLEKINKYKQSKIEKKAAEDKYLTILQETSTKNKTFIAKIKEERIKNYENKQKRFFGSNLNSMSKESYEENLIKTQKLKEQLINLESEQNKCLESFNKMKEQFDKYNQEIDVPVQHKMVKRAANKTKSNLLAKEPEKKNNKLILKKCYMKNTNKK